MPSDIFSVKPIKPPGLDIDQVRLEILNALRKEGRLQVKILKQTVANFQGEKPSFDFTISLSGGQDAQLLVAPTGSIKAVQKWIWLNEGTKAHIIRPRRAKMLRFQTGHQAGTTIRRFKTRRSRSYGPFVFAKSVRHPGTKARQWTIQLLEDRYIPYREALNNALEKGLKKGGWK